MSLDLAHSNEEVFFDTTDGIFVGTVELRRDDTVDAIGDKLKAAIPLITGATSKFVGFRRLAAEHRGIDKKLGTDRFAYRRSSRPTSSATSTLG